MLVLDHVCCFFDEFDTIGKERGDVQETGEIKRVVSSLLLRVDDLPTYCVFIVATNHAELLDRAVWRRFQIRLSLAAPDNAALARYIARRSKMFEGRLKIDTNDLAKQLSPTSYAEAEEFLVCVRRLDVLSNEKEPLSNILDEQMRMWNERVAASDLSDVTGLTSLGDA